MIQPVLSYHNLAYLENEENSNTKRPGSGVHLFPTVIHNHPQMPEKHSAQPFSIYLLMPWLLRGEGETDKDYPRRGEYCSTTDKSVTD
jgi:hypothetical protein